MTLESRHDGREIVHLGVIRQSRFPLNFSLSATLAAAAGVEVEQTFILAMQRLTLGGSHEHCKNVKIDTPHHFQLALECASYHRLMR